MKRKLRSLKAVRKTVMKRFHILIPVVMSMLLLAPPAVAAAEDRALLSLLPAGGFAEGWVMDEKPALFTQDTLFDHINGEAELYIPYGFDALATARYMKKDAAGQEIAVDVYRMGSLLDAFGIWSNYRKADAPGCALGADCVLSSSQMLFYQDRYFVRLQATGTPAPAQDVFLACGRALSQKLPQGKGRPGELELLRVRGVVPKTERYLPQSVLGYPFFRRGLTAEANLTGQRAQVFVVIEDSAAAARKAFDRYLASLKEEGRMATLSGKEGRISLEGIDPLYGKVIVELSGRYLIGAIRLKDTAAARPVIEELKNRTRPRP
jgi:hypothetical protein